MGYQAAIFDMDGTVLNPLSDLTDSINYALSQTGHRCDYTEDLVRQFFGSGITVAITRALATENGISPDDLLQIGTDHDTITPTIDAAEVQCIQEIYLPYYEAHCNDKTGPYDGIPEVLRQLKAEGVLTAVVSNKPDAAVQTLVKELFNGLFDLSVGEMVGVRRKPAPDMTEKVLKDLGINDKSKAVYIGDSEIDMQTAVNSGLDCISVDWGFRGRKFLEENHAQTIVSRPEELAELILTSPEFPSR